MNTPKSKKPAASAIALNKKARHDYFIEETLEAETRKWLTPQFKESTFGRTYYMWRKLTLRVPETDAGARAPLLAPAGV